MNSYLEESPLLRRERYSNLREQLLLSPLPVLVYYIKLIII